MVYRIQSILAQFAFIQMSYEVLQDEFHDANHVFAHLSGQIHIAFVGLVQIAPARFLGDRSDRWKKIDGYRIAFAEESNRGDPVFWERVEERDVIHGVDLEANFALDAIKNKDEGGLRARSNHVARALIAVKSSQLFGEWSHTAVLLFCSPMCFCRSPETFRNSLRLQVSDAR